MKGISYICDAGGKQTGVIIDFEVNKPLWDEFLEYQKAKEEMQKRMAQEKINQQKMEEPKAEEPKAEEPKKDTTFQNVEQKIIEKINQLLDKNKFNELVNEMKDIIKENAEKAKQTFSDKPDNEKV